MELIKVKVGVAAHEPLPDFLIGLAPESLADLSWTDPALGMQNCAWWPLEDRSQPLGPWQQYGQETLAIDAGTQTVVCVRQVIPRPPTEDEFLLAVDGMLQEGAARKRYSSIQSAALRAGYPGPFHDEGVTYATWMDSVYNDCYTLLAAVKSGTQPYPQSTDELLALLPQCPIAPDPVGG